MVVGNYRFYDFVFKANPYVPADTSYIVVDFCVHVQTTVRRQLRSNKKVEREYISRAKGTNTVGAHPWHAPPQQKVPVMKSNGKERCTMQSAAPGSPHSKFSSRHFRL